MSSEYTIDLDSAKPLDEKTIWFPSKFDVNSLPDRVTYVNHMGAVSDIGVVEKISEWNGFRIGEEVSVSYSKHSTEIIECFFRRVPDDETLHVKWKSNGGLSHDKVKVIRPLGKGHDRDDPLYDKIWDWNEHG